MREFETHRVIIDKSQINKRLDQALTNLLSNKYSRSHIKILLLNGNVKISNKVIYNVSYKVKEGDIFEISIPTIDSSIHKPQNIPLKIEYEDKDLIVLEKPNNMVTHPAPGNRENTLVNALLHYTNNNLSSYQNNNRPGIVHRLDKDTSGLLVVAKNNFTHIELAKQFKDHSIKRKYYAIVWGLPQNQIIKGNIERHKINRKKMAFNKIGKGKYSETKIRVIKHYSLCSLIECSLKTGRTHQVRVHMNHINSPIIGDKLYGKSIANRYGKDKKNFNKFLILKNFNRQALHAFSINFVHPTTKKNLKFKTDLPKDMLKLLEFVIKY